MGHTSLQTQTWPDLTGTDAQRMWAADVRHKLLIEADWLARQIGINAERSQAAGRFGAREQAALTAAISAIAAYGQTLRDQTSAEWWINHRDTLSMASDLRQAVKAAVAAAVAQVK